MTVTKNVGRVVERDIVRSVTVTGGVAASPVHVGKVTEHDYVFPLASVSGVKKVYVGKVTELNRVHGLTVIKTNFRDVPQPLSTPLGGGKWSAYITGRGGSPVIYELEFSTLSVSRVLDDTGNCRVALLGTGNSKSACCEVLANTEPWRDELVVYRDNQVAFVGPVIGIEAGKDGGTINARDLFYWTERRFIDKDHVFWGDIADTFNGLFTYAMSIDNPGVEIVTHLTGQEGQRSYKGKDFHRASDLLRELARTALDFTTIGRTVYAGGKEVFTPLANSAYPILLHDQGVMSATITKDGTQLATDVAVFAGSSDQNKRTRSEPLTARAHREEGVYGVVQQTFTELLINDLESAYANAQSRLEAMLPAPVRVSAQLSPDSAFTFYDLIPGRRVDTRLTDVACIQVMDVMRMTSVNMEVSAGSETITVELVPIGVSSDAL